MPHGASFAMMDQSREGRELWRCMQMSTHDLLCQLFEHDKVRMHFARVAGENLVSPDEKATGIGTFVFVGFLEAYGIGVPDRRQRASSPTRSSRASGSTAAKCSRTSTSSASWSRTAARAGARTKDGREFAAKDARDRRDPSAPSRPHGRGRRRRRSCSDAEATEISAGRAASPCTPR